MYERFEAVMRERFGKDSLIALATLDGATPWVRTIDAVYHEGAFYAVTHLASNKMKQIAANPVVAICGEWFTAHGTASSMGHILAPENQLLADMLRRAFAAWYDNGHTDEADPGTCILRVELTDAVLMADGERIVYP